MINLSPSRQKYVEIPRKPGCRDCGTTFRKATRKEVLAVTYAHWEGKCTHKVFVDEDAYPFTCRHCGVCGKVLGYL